MPKTYDELVSRELAESFCLQRAKITNALQRADSRETEILYRLVAREMAATEPPLIIPYAEITVSPQCTLQCRDCANLMPLYAAPRPMDTEACIAWTTGLLEAADYVLTFRVMGGEPLMQKGLPSFLEFLLAQPKIHHVQVVTNGTLAIPDACIPLLKTAKASVWISRYGPEAAPRFDDVVRQCAEHGIRAQSTAALAPWQDMGGLDIRTRDEETLKTVYRTCDMNCRHIWNGEFHVCPRSAHGRALGLIPVPERDYVPLVGNDVAERRRRLRELYDTPFVAACAHCNARGDRKPIPPAVQLGSRTASAARAAALAEPADGGIEIVSGAPAGADSPRMEQAAPAPGNAADGIEIIAGSDGAQAVRNTE